MSIGNLSKLDAVNIILRAGGERPVSALGASAENDSLLAEQILDEMNMREQSEGLFINTTEAQFTPDASTGYVELPSDTLQVRGWNAHTGRNFAHREVDGATYLYDMDGVRGDWGATRDFGTNGTDDDTVYVRLSQLIDFEDLPNQYQFAIAYEAAVQYQQDSLGSDRIDVRLQRRAFKARGVARAYDMRLRPTNYFDRSLSMGPRLGKWMPRTWPYNDVRRS